MLVRTAVRGYHVYQGVWEPRRGDVFVSLHESENRHNRYAMAVYRCDMPGIVCWTLTQGDIEDVLFFHQTRWKNQWQGDWRPKVQGGMANSSLAEVPEK